MPARVTEALGSHPDVQRVELVGSRARGGATAQELPALVKMLAEKTALVAEELGKMRGHLLEPLGVTSPPATVADAVAGYRMARDRLEHQWEVLVPRRLGDEVAAALGGHGVL